MTEISITAEKGNASPKYREGTQNQGLCFFIVATFLLLFYATFLLLIVKNSPLELQHRIEFPIERQSTLLYDAFS